MPLPPVTASTALPAAALGVACGVIYQNREYIPLQIPLLTTIGTTLSVGATTRLFSSLGLAPKTAMAFAATTSIIYYTLKPLFQRLASSPPKETAQNVALLGFTKMTTDLLNLQLPLPGKFAKAFFLTLLFLRSFDTALCFVQAKLHALNQFSSSMQNVDMNALQTFFQAIQLQGEADGMDASSDDEDPAATTSPAITASTAQGSKGPLPAAANPSLNQPAAVVEPASPRTEDTSHGHGPDHAVGAKMSPEDLQQMTSSSQTSTAPAAQEAAVTPSRLNSAPGTPSPAQKSRRKRRAPKSAEDFQTFQERVMKAAAQKAGIADEKLTIFHKELERLEQQAGPTALNMDTVKEMERRARKTAGITKAQFSDFQRFMQEGMQKAGPYQIQSLGKALMGTMSSEEVAALTQQGLQMIQQIDPQQLAAFFKAMEE
jgi:hypothetical protein